MKLLNIETPVTRNFMPQILLNVQDFYFHKVGYTSYDEGIFGLKTEHTKNTHYIGARPTSFIFFSNPTGTSSPPHFGDHCSIVCLLPYPVVYLLQSSGPLD
jgi:hypothetical protein